MRNNTVAQKVVDYIETHLDENLSLDKIAGALNYSKYYIARSFHEETKCTIYKYVKGRRLTLAAQKLVETERPIVEIAYEAHYDSQQAFTLAFKQFLMSLSKQAGESEVMIFFPGYCLIELFFWGKR